MQNIIAVTACLKRCSIAIRSGGGVFEINENIDAAQSIVSLAGDLIKSKNINLRDINKVITTSGPGSFTGIRAAQSFVKGMILTLKIPSASISYFDVIQHIYEKMCQEKNNSPQCDNNDAVLILIKSNVGKIYYNVCSRCDFLKKIGLETVTKEGVLEYDNLMLLVKELSTASADCGSRIDVIGELTDRIIDDISSVMHNCHLHNAKIVNIPYFRNAMCLINWLDDNPLIPFESLPMQMLCI
jgi:tRNA A37 threonylcarbamoyladenosine modification protein TsaB